MLSYLMYRRALSKLEERRREIVKEHGIGDPRNWDPGYQTSVFAAGVAAVCEPIEDEITELQLDYLRPIAQRHLVQIPQSSLIDDGPWRYSEHLGRYILRDDALHSLANEIRKAQKERRLEWCQWLAAFTGIIGAATGLATIVLQ